MVVDSNLTDFLNDWHELRVCQEQDHGINCCSAHKEWSTCFLRLGKLTVTSTDTVQHQQLRVQLRSISCLGTRSHALPEVRPYVTYVL